MSPGTGWGSSTSPPEESVLVAADGEFPYVGYFTDDIGYTTTFDAGSFTPGTFKTFVVGEINYSALFSQTMVVFVGTHTQDFFTKMAVTDGESGAVDLMSADASFVSTTGVNAFSKWEWSSVPSLFITGNTYHVTFYD
jgi:hypothetical protein